MPSLRWVVSLLIVYHLVALGSAAIPAPEALSAVGDVRHPRHDALAEVVTPVLDRAAMALSRIEPVLFLTLRPLRRVTQSYIAAGLGGQQWNMFSSPYTVDKYVRIDYYVTSDADARGRRVLREVVLPADHEEQVRLLHQFRDKAILNTLETYFVAVSTDRNAAAPAKEPFLGEEHARRGFEPIVRYFSRRLRRYLAPGERVVQAELWYGEAAIPPPRQKLRAEVLRERLDTLNLYHDGPAPVISGPASARRRGANDRTADIRWTLEFVEEFRNDAGYLPPDDPA